MKKILSLFLFLLLQHTVTHAQLTKLMHVYEGDGGFASCIERDNNGAIYMAGRIGANALAAANDTIYNSGFFLTKMNLTGTQIWRKNNIRGKKITPRSILIDNGGCIYVIGNFYDTLQAGNQLFSTTTPYERKFFIAKYNNTGNFLWIKVSASDESFIYSADIRNNQLYLAGGFSGTLIYNGINLLSAGVTDICVLKLDTAGNVISGNRYGGTGEDKAEKIKTDNNGNIFVCGQYSGSFMIAAFSLIAHGYTDCFLMKADSSFNISWVKTAGSSWYDEMRSMAIDSSGNIYVAGRSGNSTFYFDPAVYLLNNANGFIAKYNASGNFLTGTNLVVHGNVIDLALVNNNPVVCGKGINSASFSPDASITFSNQSTDGYFIAMDNNLSAIEIGKYSYSVNQTSQRCFKVYGIGGDKFLIAGYCSNEVKMPDTTYHHLSALFFNSSTSGSAFLQKISLAHLTVTPSDTLIVPAFYSTANPLNLSLNFNGLNISPASTAVILGYPKTPISNYLFEGNGNFINSTVTVNSPLVNPPSGSGDYYMNLNFSNKNLMIRSDNMVSYCSSFVSNISGPIAICTGDTVTLTGSSAYQNYLWFPVAGIITMNNNSITSAPSISTTYNFIAHTTSNTCAVGTKLVSVNNQSIAHVSFTNLGSNNCSPVQFSFEVFNCVSLSGSPFVFLYKNGIQMASSNLSSGIFTATTVGNYYVRVVSGCGWDIYSDTISITTIIPPITYAGTISANTNYMCNGSSVLLTLINHPTNVFFEWYFNGVVIANAAADTLTAFQTGSYYVKVYNGCNSYFNSGYFYLYPLGVQSVNIYTTNMTQGCAGAFVNFYSSFSNYGGGSISYQWLRDGVSIVGASFNNYSTNQNGTYSLRINHTCGVTYSNGIVVHLNNPVVAAINALGATNFCSGQSVLLTASPGVDYFYQWRLNGTDLADSTNQQMQVSQSGSYSCLISNFCNSNLSNIVLITVTPSLPDSISTSDSLNICPGQSVTFTAPFFSGVNYLWFRNGNSINGAIANSYQTSIAGTYTCRFSNLCGTVFSNSLVLNSFNLSNLIFAPLGTNLCQGDSVYLLAATNAQLLYQWRLNGTNIAGATNNFFYATAPGNYTCEFSSATCGIFYSTAIAINYFQLSSLIITSSQGNILCQGIATDLIAPNGIGFSFQWLLNNNPITGATNSIYSTPQAGIYSCFVQSACVSDTTNSLIISQGPPPPSVSISFSGNDTICGNNFSLLVSNATNVTAYQWQFNGLNISGSTNANYSANTTGVYQCAVQNYCGFSISNGLQLLVMPLPGTNTLISGDSVLCEGQSAVLSVSSNSNFTYQWYFNSAPISGATDFQYVALVAGNYFCSIQSYCGNYFSNQIHITVNPLPVTPAFSIVGNILSCTTIAPTYQWYFNGAIISGAVYQNYQAPQSGFYSVAVFNNFGCSSLALPVFYSSQNYLPIASCSYSANSICAGSCISYSDNSTNQPNFWQWNFQGGNPSTSSQPNPTVCYNQPGNYNVQLISGNTYGFDTLLLTQLITVNTIPAAIITQQHDTLFTTPGMVQYQWYLNGNTIAGATNNFYIATVSGNYKVFVAGNGGCSNTTLNNYNFVAKPFASFNISNNTICMGDCISLTDGSTNTPTSWHWILPGSAISNSNAQNPQVCYNLQGSWTVTLISTNATGSDTNTINNLVIVHPPPPIPVISVNGNMLSSTVAETYQWYLNGNLISGAIFQQIIITTYGNYRVMITDSFGCSSQSAVFNYTGTNDLFDPNLQIVLSPNPADNYFNVSFLNNGVPENLKLTLLNNLGQVVATKNFRLLENSSSVTLETAELPAGCYHLFINGERVNDSKKLIVIH